jgi:hypothetical protein
MKFYKYAGIAASIVLIAFGVGSVVTGIDGRDRVHDDLAREQIVGTPDMKGVANKKVDTGGEAQDFATGIRNHALEASGGLTYSQMPRYMGTNGKATNDEKLAAINPQSGKPADNPARQQWVTATALSTALNTAYFAESVSTFAIVMGFAMLLIGIGFLVVMFKLLPTSASEREKAPTVVPKPVVAT